MKNPKTTASVSRRNFIQTGAAATSFMVLPNWVIGQSASPNGKLNVAVIGAGGRGKAHVSGLQGENFVGFCDVDDKTAADTYKKFPKVARFKDYRKMFDKLQGKIDAVSIATPDHMHYPIALWALSQGINVYCEKPLVRTIWEARQLKAAAAKAGVVTQMGNQGHTHEGLRLIQEWTQANVVGDIVEVFHWTNRPVWPQGEIKRQEQPIPSTLNYKMWLGVAPDRPYSNQILPFKWRGWKDYGCGAVGDMACHIMDAGYSGLGLTFPKKVKADASGSHADTFPKAATIEYEFEYKGKPLKVTWLDGGRLPDISKISGMPQDFFTPPEGSKKKTRNDNGTLIVGTKGVIQTDTYSSSVRIFPDKFFKELKSSKGLPPKTLARVKGGPFAEFVGAIKAGKQAGSAFSYAADFVENALLGLVAAEAGQPIEYDGANMKITNIPEANKFLRSQYEYKKEFLPA